MALDTAKYFKYSVIVTNVIIIVCGVILLAISSSIQQQINSTRLSDTIGGYSIPAGSIIGIITGILFVILGIVGVYAAVKERYKFLIGHTASMGFIFIIQLITGAVALAIRNDPKFVRTVSNKYMSEFKANSTNEGRRDHLQQYFKCCGWNGITDYITFKDLINVPISCCKDKGKCDINDLSNLFENPCKEPITTYVRHYIEVIGVALIVFACINIVAIAINAVYVRFLKNND